MGNSVEALAKIKINKHPHPYKKLSGGRSSPNHLLVLNKFGNSFHEGVLCHFSSVVGLFLCLFLCLIQNNVL